MRPTPPLNCKATGHSGKQHGDLVQEKNIILNATVIYDATNPTSNQRLPRKITFKDAPRQN